MKVEFQPGDIVQLKSGGRALTVAKASKTDVDVIWYAETDDAIRTATVPVHCLDKIELADDEDFDEE
jgi:uncharacterized protein YodC (DUF2158 family)